MSKITGLVSNFLDSGYNVSGLSIYDSNNNLITSAINNTDIYITTQTIGVIMFNGSGLSYPMYCSASNLNNLCAPNDSDDYYIVYPGWGFTLYDDPDYSGSSSKQYMNNTSSPILFSSLDTIGTVNIQSSTSTDAYGDNITASIQIYFRGVEVTVTGIS
jgi:hypothetical protein